MKRVLHIVRSGDPATLPAGALAEGDVLVYTYEPAAPPATPWLLWHRGDPARAPHHVQVIDTAALCELVFRVDTVVVW